MAHSSVDSPRTRHSSTQTRVLDRSPPPSYDTLEVYPTSPQMDHRMTSSSRGIDVLIPLGDCRSQTLARSRRGPTALSIPRLREALHSLESKMATLLNERELLESSLEQAVRLQSPIQRLPEELLSAIFEIGVLYDDDEDSLMLSNMMLVCRYWRDVAVNTASLWSRIMTGTHHSLERARLKLHRSKAAPLDVYVDFSPRTGYGTVATECLVQTMDLLQPSIRRWRAFYLTVPHRPQAHVALIRCKDRAPLLEVFTVRVCHSMHEDHYSHPPLPLFEGRTPRLHSCSFTSFDFNWDPSIVCRLRVLKLGGYWNGVSPSVDVILGMLRACPQLEELALRNMSDVYSRICSLGESMTPDGGSVDKLMRTADTKQIQLPSLTKVSFYYCGNLRTQAILSHLSFPALEQIELCFLDNVSPIVEQLRRQSLTRLPLRHLRIEASYFNEMRLVRLLRRLPALTTLEFVDVEDASSNLMKNFAIPPAAQTWMCPKLVNLNLEGCTSLDWESLRTCVESRLPMHARAFPRQMAGAPSVSVSRYPTTKVTSTASSFAAQAHILSRVPAAAANGGVKAPGWPCRLESINLTRCHQINKEMLQWLRMYVMDVRCESVKGVWGDVPVL